MSDVTNAALEEAATHLKELRRLFELIMTDQGQTVVRYNGLRGRTSVRCPEGHTEVVTPLDVVDGRTAWPTTLKCRACSNAALAEKFNAALKKLARRQRATLTDTGRRNRDGFTEYDCRCNRGHAFTIGGEDGTRASVFGKWHKGMPGPHRVRTPDDPFFNQDDTLCPWCRQEDKYAAAHAKAMEVIESTGAVIVKRYSNGLGVLCKRRHRTGWGHHSFNYDEPNEISSGFCRDCTRFEQLEDLRSRAAKLGITVLEDTWLAKSRGHRAVCYVGHEFDLVPSKLGRGCTECPRNTYLPGSPDHSVYYVVSGVDRLTGRQTVKPGISTGSGWNRLRDHAADGLTNRHILTTGLPQGFAQTLEVFVLDYLKANGWHPTRGREYFPDQARVEVLGEASNWLANELWVLPAKHGPWLKGLDRAPRPSDPAGDPVALLDFAD